MKAPSLVAGSGYIGWVLPAPRGKIVGRSLAPFLGGFAGVESPSKHPAVPGTVPVEVDTEYGFHHLPVVEDERLIGMLGLRRAARRAQMRTTLGSGF